MRDVLSAEIGACEEEERGLDCLGALLEEAIEAPELGCCGFGDGCEVQDVFWTCKADGVAPKVTNPLVRKELRGTGGILEVENHIRNFRL